MHAAYWLVFWLVYAYTYSRYDGNLPKYLLTEAIQMPARMLATYGSIFCFRYFSSPKTAWPAFVGAAVFSVLGGWMNRLIKLFWLVPAYFPDSTIAFWDSRMMYDIFDCVLAASIALSVQMYFRQQDLLRSREMLRAEKYEAELQALKSQIHPHFLFNTINNLYALARVKSDQTAPVALQLAQLLRYLLYESAKPSVPLRQEIKLLEDYIALEKLRYDEDRLQVNYTCGVDNPEQPISPLLLLPLVENAFQGDVKKGPAKKN